MYVATIEKASGLVNSLLGEGRIKELGLVVVDEVHMLGESGGRGSILENFLTVLRYAARKVLSRFLVYFKVYNTMKF